MNQLDNDQPTSPHSKRPLIGILGGMGPLAGVDFAQKLIAVSATTLNVKRDQDQTPFILWSVPQIADRTKAVLDPTAPDPFSAMAAGIRGLANAGADVIVVVCNTAHHWHARLSECSLVPILHIADSAISAMEKLPGIERVGILGGPGTLQREIYQGRLREKGYACLIPTPEEVDTLLMRSIMLVKQGRIDESVPLADEVFARLTARGAQAIILACTELPLIFARPNARRVIPTVDPNEALAIAAVQWEPRR
jgi:aspartate racemase